MHLNARSHQATPSGQDAPQGMDQHLQYVKAMQVTLAYEETFKAAQQEEQVLSKSRSL